MKPRLLGSLTGRILWLHIATAVFGAVLLPLALQTLLANQSQQIHYESMVQKAERLASALTASPDGRLSINLPRDDAATFAPGYGRFAYAVIDEDGRALLSSRGPQQRLFDEAEPGAALQTILDGSLYAGLRREVQVGPRRYFIEVAENMSHRDVLIDDVSADFIPWIVATSLVFFGIILVIDIVVVRHTFRPLLRASALARQIGPRRTDIRLDPNDAPAEARDLVAAVNEAIDRLDQGFEAQRNFAEDAAHELRTPLAILRARIEMMQEDKALSRSLREEVDAMSRTIDQLLELADVEAHGADPYADVDLNELCAGVLEHIAPLVIRQGREIALVRSAEPAVVRGDSPMLARAVRNLVENALKHSPPQTPITVTVEKAAVIVRDEGAGFEVQEAQQLFERHWRADRTPASAGKGLGLSIVKRIMEQHGGGVEAMGAPNAGAAFRLKFAVPQA